MKAGKVAFLISFIGLVIFLAYIICSHNEPLATIGAPAFSVSEKQINIKSTAIKNTDTTNTQPNSYSITASNLLKKEVLSVIKDLQLVIHPNSETTVWLAEPNIAQGYGILGVFRHGDYLFCASKNSKICYVELYSGNNRLTYLKRLKSESTLAIDKLDTNAAVNIAIDWLNKGRIDTERLMQDATVTVRYWHIGNTHFVPLYWVLWVKENQTLALVSFYAPHNSLLQLRIEDDKYNRRSRLVP